MKLTIQAGFHARQNCPIAVRLPDGASYGAYTLTTPAGDRIPAFAAAGTLRFVLPSLGEGEGIHNIADCFLCHFGFQGFILTVKLFDFCLHMCDLFCCFCRRSFQHSCDFSQLLLGFFIITEYPVSSQCFDSTYPCRNTCFGYNLESCDHTRIRYMGTATKFF